MLVLNGEDALNKNLEPANVDPVLLTIANSYLEGKDVMVIAEECNISVDRVVNALEKKEVKTYIDNVFLAQGYLHRAKRLNLINKVIEKKIEEAEETDVFTKKDLLDWLKHLHEIESAARPKEKGPAVAVQINNYDKFMENILE